MPHRFFRWMGCSDKRRARSLDRDPSVKLRVAQMTDLHVPSDIPLSRRLRDLMRPHRSVGDLSHELSAISNEFGQPYRKNRQVYTNLLKKTLLGLRYLDVDHLIITGDVAHCGLAVEFLEAKAALQVTGWWGPDKLTVIPGNHDRFNLYEAIPDQPMEEFFDVVSSRAPRVKTLPGGLALVEVDSNSDRDDDRAYSERWLPNTKGRVYQETVDAIDAERERIAGMRVITLVHHHVTDDWCNRNTWQRLGFLDPAEGVEELMSVTSLVDPHGLLLHGHIHDVMSLDYTYLDAHPVGCPGGFAEHLRLNVIDLDVHDELTMTQIELRGAPSRGRGR